MKLRVVLGVLCGSLSLLAVQACGSSQSTGDGRGGDSGLGDSTTGAGDGSGDDRGSSSDSNGGSSSGGGSDGSFLGDGGPCTPGCPSNVTCGIYKDCTGQILSCGMPCTKGESCITSGSGQSCQAPSCTGKCGDIAIDSCGIAVSCGACPKGEVCVNNACTTETPMDAGAPDANGCNLTCSPKPGVNLCGTVSDGCGQTKNCTCPADAGDQCNGGVCGPPLPECHGDGGVGSPCGSVSNACGSGNVACGACSGATTCEKGTCTACAPPTCGKTTCGSVSNGCGPAAECGSCTGSDKCYQGSCCGPNACAAVPDAGCAPVDLGCGVSEVCNPCPMGEVCTNNACCTPSTCGELIEAGTTAGCTPVDLGCGQQKSCAPCAKGYVCQNDECVACVAKTCGQLGPGCGLNDGCGATLNCCAAGTTCLNGNLCCATGEVDYQGACCKPQCDPNQPPGVQVSCGEVIYCSGGGGPPQ